MNLTPERQAKIRDVVIHAAVSFRNPELQFVPIARACDEEEKKNIGRRLYRTDSMFNYTVNKMTAWIIGLVQEQK
jgi:hypothetical protein